MKKFLLFLFLFFILSGCSNKVNYSQILLEFSNTLEIPTEIDDDIQLYDSYSYNDYVIYAKWYSYDTEYISNDGKIHRTDDDIFITLFVELTLDSETITKSFDITILKVDPQEKANEILNLINIPSEIYDDITLISFIEYEDKTYRVTWESADKSLITNAGEITFNSTDKEVTLTASISYNKTKYSKDFNIIIKAYNLSILEGIANSLNISDTISENLNLITSYESDNHNFTINWNSSNPTALSNDGEIGILLNDTIINLTATIEIDNVSLSKTFAIKVLKSSTEQILNILDQEINIQKIITSDIFLPTQIYDNITCTWSSSDINIIDDQGYINYSINTPTTVSLTANFKIGDDNMTKEFNTIVSPISHFYLTDKFVGEYNNIELANNGRLVLTNNALEGSFISDEVDHSGFYEAVASWGAISSKNATCELLVSIKVGDTFSDYISYGIWGLGLQNKCVDQSNNLIKLSTDEIIVLNNKNATGFKYKIILRRDNLNVSSPEVFLVAFSFKINNYNYSFDESLLNNSVKYDVPKLYQHDVPNIGNSICSATSSTMLLKYKGHNFKSINPLEHEYIAGLVKDYGNNIFGNWVYNCVGISSFDEFAYVKRFANKYEFLYNLQEIGPMAASIKGTVNYTRLSDGLEKSYTTNGHLIVVTGFEITENETYIYINDPNVYTVAIKMTFNNFLSVWRNISYVVE